ncbi:MAG: substrate-binding domain-containing protein [Lentisphaeria bacterium]|nr:substrate-binding domain-containing protein [Lentisphaeria bacterium]
MRNWKRVLVIANAQFGNHRNLLKGIAEFSQEIADWEVEISSVEDLNSEYDPGIVGYIAPQAAIQTPWFHQLMQNKTPLVFYGNRINQPPFNKASQFFPDEKQIGKLAATHLINKGFHEVAYISHDTWPCSEERGHGFADIFHDKSRDIKTFYFPKNNEKKAFLKWLSQPGGSKAVFCVTDIVSSQVLLLARQHGFQCPKDYSLLGVDNNELLCTLSYPSLSSIATNWFGMGYDVAQQLNKEMNGPSKSVNKTCPPDQVITRTSTDLMGVDDELVLKAFQYIQRNFKNAISTESVVTLMHVSRPTLDNRFKKVFGKSVSEQINDLRIEFASHLLRSSSMNIQTITNECGILNNDRLYRLFHKRYGLTPGEYRKQHLKED